MMGRGLGGRAARLPALLVAMLLVATFTGAASGATTRTANDKVLGAKNPAKGTPVKIGVISNGKSSSVDNSDESTVAAATSEWINEYRNGLGGHPIDLSICTDANEPSKAADCANQMIQDKVAAVVIAQDGVVESAWTPLHDVGIPVFVYGAGNPNIVADTTSTFVLVGPRATLLALPAGVAKKTKAKKVSAVIIDVPAATSFFKDPGPQLYKELGLDLELIPVPPGTADMTPQMQRLVSGNPKGVVFVVGNDAFCIAAFNGLRTAGFEGNVATIVQCLTDATRTAVPGDFLEGMQIASFAPITNTRDPSIKQYFAVLDKYGADDVDRSNTIGAAMFNALAGFDVATEGLKGGVTPASIITAAKAMPWSVMPGSGGLHFRCNGKADPENPAVCTTATNAATLDASGKPTKYTPVNDTPIPD